MTIASTSIAAYHSLSSAATVRLKIAEIVEAHEEEGCIADDVLDFFPSSMWSGGTISSRFSELERLGLLYKAGDKRLGHSKREQFVWRHTKYLTTVPVLPTKKPKKNPFLEGMIFAAKTIVKQSDLLSAKHALGQEIRKVAAK